MERLSQWMLNGEDGDRHRGWKDFNSGCWRQTPTTTKTKQNKTKMGGGGVQQRLLDGYREDRLASLQQIERQTEGTGKPSSLEAGRRGDKERMVRL